MGWESLFSFVAEVAKSTWQLACSAHVYAYFAFHQTFAPQNADKVTISLSLNEALYFLIFRKTAIHSFLNLAG